MPHVKARVVDQIDDGFAYHLLEVRIINVLDGNTENLNAAELIKARKQELFVIVRLGNTHRFLDVGEFVSIVTLIHQLAIACGLIDALNAVLCRAALRLHLW